MELKVYTGQKLEDGVYLVYCPAFCTSRYHVVEYSNRSEKFWSPATGDDVTEYVESYKRLDK